MESACADRWRLLERVCCVGFQYIPLSRGKGVTPKGAANQEKTAQQRRQTPTNSGSFLKGFAVWVSNTCLCPGRKSHSARKAGSQARRPSITIAQGDSPPKSQPPTEEKIRTPRVSLSAHAFGLRTAYAKASKQHNSMHALQ